jgi:hypothetical protein
MTLGQKLQAPRARAPVEAAVGTAVAGERLPQIVWTVWILQTLCLLRLIAGARQIPIGK